MKTIEEVFKEKISQIEDKFIIDIGNACYNTNAGMVSAKVDMTIEDKKYRLSIIVQELDEDGNPVEIEE